MRKNLKKNKKIFKKSKIFKKQIFISRQRHPGRNAPSERPDPPAQLHRRTQPQLLPLLARADRSGPGRERVEDASGRHIRSTGEVAHAQAGWEPH